jgi:hypothetical protein
MGVSVFVAEENAISSFIRQFCHKPAEPSAVPQLRGLRTAQSDAAWTPILGVTARVARVYSFATSLHPNFTD